MSAEGIADGILLHQVHRPAQDLLGPAVRLWIQLLI